MNTKTLSAIILILLLQLLNVNLRSQNCLNNFIDNPTFANANPRPGYPNQVVPTSGWTSLIPISNSNSNSVEFFKPNTALQSNWVPQPATGNYLAMWISNSLLPQTTYREAAINKLISPIAQNSGVYTLTFDYCCLNTCSNDGGSSGELMPEIAIYGMHNPNNLPYTSFQSSHIPTNLNLLPNGNIFLLSKSKIAKECGNELFVVNAPINERGKKYLATYSINSNTFNNSITHILITHSDEVLPNASSFVGLDNFCLIKKPNSNPCNELLKENKLLKDELEKCCRKKPKPAILNPKQKKK